MHQAIFHYFVDLCKLAFIPVIMVSPSLRSPATSMFYMKSGCLCHQIIVSYSKYTSAYITSCVTYATWSVEFLYF